MQYNLKSFLWTILICLLLGAGGMYLWLNHVNNKSLTKVQIDEIVKQEDIRLETIHAHNLDSVKLVFESHADSIHKANIAMEKRLLEVTGHYDLQVQQIATYNYNQSIAYANGYLSKKDTLIKGVPFDSSQIAFYNATYYLLQGCEAEGKIKDSLIKGKTVECQEDSSALATANKSIAVRDTMFHNQSLLVMDKTKEVKDITFKKNWVTLQARVFEYGAIGILVYEGLKFIKIIK